MILHINLYHTHIHIYIYIIYIYIYIYIYIIYIYIHIYIYIYIYYVYIYILYVCWYYMIRMIYCTCSMSDEVAVARRQGCKIWPQRIPGASDSGVHWKFDNQLIDLIDNDNLWMMDVSFWTCFMRCWYFFGGAAHMCFVEVAWCGLEGFFLYVFLNGAFQDLRVVAWFPFWYQDF